MQIATRPRMARGGLAALALGVWACAAGAAGLPRGPDVIGAACPGPGAARLLLLPEDASAVGAGLPGAVTVSGAYTGADRRAGDRPKPVGLHFRQGALVSLEFARMDGLLLVRPDGSARIAAAASAPVRARRHDLRDLAGRRAFARAAEAAGLSALQSHLLIRDGALDLRPVEGAPRAERRILFQTREGALALWQSRGRALTLHAAAAELAAKHAPRMALNLDMGGHDFCLRRTEAGEALCGRLTRAEMDRLSNLVRLNTDRSCDPD